MLDQKVLSRIYLDGVLPAMEVLTAEDPTASSLAGQWNGRIRFAVGFTGPRCDVLFENARVKVEPGAKRPCDIYLFFPNTAMVNALFSSKGISIPIPLKGFTRLRGMLIFSRLANHMEKVLGGNKANENLRAQLTLGILARSMAIIAGSDPEMRPLTKKLHGKAEFRIRDGHAVHVDFTGHEPRSILEPSGSPDFLLEFATDDLFLRVSEDKVDVLAEACLLNIGLKGDLHMGQTINVLLDRISLYLPPKEVAK
jgi:hypothetical protein